MVDTVYTRTHEGGRVEVQIYAGNPGRCQPLWSVDEKATRELRAKDDAQKQAAPQKNWSRKKAKR